MLRTTAIAIGIVMAAVVGCGKTTITADEACSDLATVQCMKRASCTNSAGITRNFGDMSTCLAREKLTCMNALAAPATGNSPALVEKCVADFATYSCQDFGDNNPPADCVPSGSRALDGACTFNGQCATGFCAKNKQTVCGSCAPAPMPGDACESSNCGHDQICVSGDVLVCQIRGTLNVQCNSAMPCGTGLSCVGATALASGTCQNALTMAGAACGGATMPGCDNNFGLHCGGPAGTGRSCVTTTFAPDGMPCGTMGDGSFVQCEKGDCYTATGLITAGQQGTCKADAADGAGCDTALGPACTPPARCIVGAGLTSGVCTVPLGSTCG